jgi:hybrid cluster-associated redox disulfide protein
MAIDPQEISARLTVKEVLDRCPQALPVFMQLRLLCVGCPTEAFHTLADVAREYDLDIEQLLNRIRSAIAEQAH